MSRRLSINVHCDGTTSFCGAEGSNAVHDFRTRDDLDIGVIGTVEPAMVGNEIGRHCG
jgi:hypothetical protein